ncbi:MAG: hypothetical protein MUQ48_06180, partial [Pirellulales bacterium]|nr:hypothetical protein [Pirellulales bacterium]
MPVTVAANQLAMPVTVAARRNAVAHRFLTACVRCTKPRNVAAAPAAAAIAAASLIAEPATVAANQLVVRLMLLLKFLLLQYPPMHLHRKRVRAA